MERRWPLKRGDYASTAAKRATFRELLLRNGFENELETHELVFGELITNAVKYGDEPMFVTVEVVGRKMRIRVEDSGKCFDLRLSMLKQPSTEGGRGLHIVKALASSLTVEKSKDFPCQITATMPL